MDRRLQFSRRSVLFTLIQQTEQGLHAGHAVDDLVTPSTKFVGSMYSEKALRWMDPKKSLFPTHHWAKGTLGLGDLVCRS